MNKNIQLLDCTLREAPVDNFFIGESFIEKFIRQQEVIGIDIIECGFLKDGKYETGCNCFEYVENIKNYIPHKKANILYVALVDYGRFSVDNLSDYDGTSIDGVRICFKHGEQNEAIRFAEQIKSKGYKIFIQHVDTLDYSDIEIIELIDLVNQLMPYGYSIVDTFGSMYQEDMERLSSLINYHLDTEIVLGFHAHNNLMLANANVERFVSHYIGKRNIMVDTSVLGCGRGAGNANTELIAEFLNHNYHSKYNINGILDLIDTLMPELMEKCNWGYSIPYLLSGIHSTHVYNANYLLKRHNISLQDLREILESIDKKNRKVYNYPLLEKLYVEHFSNAINDESGKKALKRLLVKDKILLIATGKSAYTKKEKIHNFIRIHRPIVIGINNYIDEYHPDIVFFSNRKRYQLFRDKGCEKELQIVLTSNILANSTKEEILIDYESLLKYGWVNIDSSMILFLRLLLSLEIYEMYVAGFDGFYGGNPKDFYIQGMETDMKAEDLEILCKENEEMLLDLKKSNSGFVMHFVTPSKYEKVFEDI